MFGPHRATGGETRFRSIVCKCCRVAAQAETAVHYTKPAADWAALRLIVVFFFFFWKHERKNIRAVS